MQFRKQKRRPFPLLLSLCLPPKWYISLFSPFLCLCLICCRLPPINKNNRHTKKQPTPLHSSFSLVPLENYACPFLMFFLSESEKRKEGGLVFAPVRKEGEENEKRRMHS